MLKAAQLRAKAREALEGNWGLAVLVCLISGLIMGASSFTGLGTIVLIGPVTLGLAFFFLDITRKKPAKIETAFKGFNYFLNSFVLGLLYSLFIIVWSLLFIIPGIIKAYAYSMCYYIMADNPQIDGNSAIKESIKIMKGNKWRLFCLDFSFIGWILLCVLTFGIGYLWLIPYMQASRVQFYENLKITKGLGGAGEQAAQ